MARARFTAAVEDMQCPRCGVQPGQNCKQPKGRKQWPPHRERVALLDPSIGLVQIKRTL